MVDDELIAVLMLLLLPKLRDDDPDPKRGGVDGNASLEGDFANARWPAEVDMTAAAKAILILSWLKDCTALSDALVYCCTYCC